MGIYFLKVAGWWGLSCVKFLFVPFFMIHSEQEHWSWLETVLISSSGAAGGVFIFFHLGEYIFIWWYKHIGKKKKVMTKGRRWTIRMKHRWGIGGLMVISPFISVPVASLLAARFYRHNQATLPLMITAFFVWSVVLTSVAYASKILLS